VTERQRSDDGWSYIAGDKGRDRVRVYTRGDRDGEIWIDYRDASGKRVRQSLKHTDRDLAKAKAKQVVAEFAQAPRARPIAEPVMKPALTISALIDIYETEVTPRKCRTTQSHDRRTFLLFLRAFGPSRVVTTLTRRDVESYAHRRRTGDLAVPGHEHQPVRTRVLEQDIGLLKAMLNWAVDGDGDGGILLDRNPIARAKVPREKHPTRAVVTREQFGRLMAAAARKSADLELFTAMTWFTGHRSQSIRLLTWSDIELAAGRIHWRGENDKIGLDHRTPIHPELTPYLERARAVAELTRDRWVFPSPRDHRKPLTGNAVVNLWKRLAPKAGIPTGERYGWHSMRRAFANNLRDVSLRDLQDLGGWTTERTIVAVYQQQDEDAQRRALRALSGPKQE
jgi:integrase